MDAAEEVSLAAFHAQLYQWCPKPVAALRIPEATHSKKKAKDTPSPRYVVKSASAGSRHTLILMIDTLPKDPDADKGIEKAEKSLELRKDPFSSSKITTAPSGNCLTIFSASCSLIFSKSSRRFFINV